MTRSKAKRLIIAIDVGGSKVAGGLWLMGGGLSGRCEEPTRVDSDDDVVSSITRVLDRLVEEAGSVGNILAVGMGIPGQVDIERGTVYSPTNLRLKRPVPLKTIIETRYGYPLFFDNDANAGAMGEAKFGAAVGMNNFIYLSLGTGIGVGIFINGSVFRGANGLAGEAGHMSIIADGPECPCGGRGCVENLISGRVISCRVSELLNDPAGCLSILREVRDKQGGLTAKDIFIAAAGGDELAKTVISEIIFYLGTLIGNMINLLDPEAVILGGGMGQNVDQLIVPLNEFLARRMNLNRRKIPKVIGSGLGENSGIIGAAALCFQQEPIKGAIARR